MNWRHYRRAKHPARSNPPIGSHAPAKEVHSYGLTESVQRIIVRRALAGQQPQTAAEVIAWLEDTVAGWNEQPTPFVWDGKRRRRRERAHLRRLGGSAAAVDECYSIAA